MNATQLSSSHGAAAASPGRRIRERLPSWLQGRRAWVLAAVAFAGAGLALGWPWLAAAGLAPLAISLLPCAAMCALGLCMMGGKDGKSCSSQADAPGPEARPSR